MKGFLKIWTLISTSERHLHAILCPCEAIWSRNAGGLWYRLRKQTVCRIARVKCLGITQMSELKPDQKLHRWDRALKSKLLMSNLIKVSHQCGNWTRGTCLDRSGRLIISNLNSIICSDWLAHMFHYHFGTCRHSCELCAADPDLGFALPSSRVFSSFFPAISDDDNEGKNGWRRTLRLCFSQLRDL